VTDESWPRQNKTLQHFFPGPLAAADNPCLNGRERCVASFGIYGHDPFYLEGGLRNIMQAQKYWPGWKLRFYTDGSMPAEYVKQLTTATSEVIVIKGVPGKIAGMFWRFFVMNDPSVDRFIVRDIDSNPGSRERAAMDEWILSGRQWHVFRDHPDHENWPMLGGCFGGARQRQGQNITEGILPYHAVEGKIRQTKRMRKFVSVKGGDQVRLGVSCFTSAAFGYGWCEGKGSRRCRNGLCSTFGL
jgi:hypothetical protein